MGKLYKQFVALVTKWRHDEFSVARLKLTAAYFVTATALLGISSYLLYETSMKALSDSFEGNFASDITQQLAFNNAADILQTRIVIVDSIVLVLIIFFGFLLTKLTLRPIKKSLDAQKRFVADAAHDLRTPLTVMKTEMEVALRKEENMPQTSKKVIISALEEIDRLTILSNDLLQIARGQMERKKDILSVNKIIQRAIDRLLPLANKKNINIKNNSEKEAYTEGDFISLERAFYNVIHNAIIYTPNNKDIEIQIEKRHSSVEIIVSDSGIGIPQDHIPRIFDPFYRVDSSRTSSDGSGLGLAIVKTIINQCGGNVSVKSTVNKGTRFIISLPSAKR
jgi:signal transduction histidine kinase